MATKPDSGRITPEQYEWCEKFARKIIANLERPNNAAEARSASISSHGAETNFGLQRDAKAAECWFCNWAGLDWKTALGWRTADDGKDVLWRTIRLDIKHTPYVNGALIWPYRKAEMFHVKHFDALVLVKGTEYDFWLDAWTSKTQFKFNHIVADKHDKRFHPGTMYMDQENLWPIRSLVAAEDYEIFKYKQPA